MFGTPFIFSFIRPSGIVDPGTSVALSTYQPQLGGVPAELPLPLDYTVRKHIFSMSGGDFTVEDAHGNLAFKVRGGISCSLTGSATKHIFLLDASGNPLLSLDQKPEGFDWECCRRNWFGYEDLVFRVRKRQQASKWEKELEVYLGLEPKRCYCSGMSSTPWDMLVKGSPFARSCSIYKGNTILAQVSKDLIGTPIDSTFTSSGCGSQA